MKKIIIVTLLIICVLTNIAFAANIDMAAAYLNKQELDHWGLLALYNYGKDINKKSFDIFESEITTDHEAYILGAVPLGENVYEEVKKVCKVQTNTGKFADYIDGTGEDYMNAHIWGIISLYVAGYEEYDKDKALKWLKENQNNDGGFPVYVGHEYSDLDMTAMGLVAYSILGMNFDSDAVKKGIAYLEKNLSNNESAESYSWYILARIKLGISVDKKLYDNLMKYQMQDGSFMHLDTMKKSSYIATWHGLLAWTDYNNQASVFDKVHNLIKFVDLGKKEYAYNEVIALVAKGVLSGYPDKTFRGKNPVKRSEFSKLLVYGLDLERDILKETTMFSDLKGHWSNKIINVAVQNNLIKGIGNNLFAPEAKITGKEVATILVRAQNLEEEALAIKGINWYDGYVQTAQKYKLLYDGFNPNTYASRSQCAEAIYKLITKN